MRSPPSLDTIKVQIVLFLGKVELIAVEQYSKASELSNFVYAR